MKTKRYFFGLPVMLLALGLVLAASLTLAGCGEEEEESASAAISGTAKVGETLTATFTGFTPATSHIYWKSASTATGQGDTISYGATTYDIKQSDLNDYIWVEASNSDRSVEVVSARVGPVAAAN